MIFFSYGWKGIPPPEGTVGFEFEPSVPEPEPDPDPDP